MRHAVPTEDAVALHAQVDRSFIGLHSGRLDHRDRAQQHRATGDSCN
jgi:hypothetical protein